MGAAANMADRMSQMEAMDGAARCLESLRLQVSVINLLAEDLKKNINFPPFRTKFAAVALLSSILGCWKSVAASGQR